MFMYLFVFLLPATNIFCEQSTSSTQQWLPKILWTFWQNPLTDKDNILKSFHHNHVKMLPGWQVNLLDKNTAVEWLRKVPDYKDELQLDYFKNDVPAKRANLVRFAMLKHFGGVWVDFTTIITSNFEWLFQLKKQEYIINAKGDAPEVFMVYRQIYNKQTYFSKKDNQQYLLSPAFEIYFIAAAPKNKLLQQTYQMYLQGKAQNIIKYGNDKQKSVIVDKANQQIIKLAGFDIPYFETEACIQTILQRKQRQFDKNQNSGERQLSVHYYKVWGMSSDKTAFLLDAQTGKHDRYGRVVHMTFQSDIEYLKSKSVFPKYFVKFVSDTFNQTKRFIIDLNSSKKVSQFSCPQGLSILQNSIAFQYMLKDFPKYYQNQIVKISFNRDCYLPSFPLTLKDYVENKNNGKITYESVNHYQLKSTFLFFLSLSLLLIVVILIARRLKIIKQTFQLKQKMPQFIETSNAKNGEQCISH